MTAILIILGIVTLISKAGFWGDVLGYDDED